MTRSGSDAEARSTRRRVVQLGSRSNRYIGLVTACFASWLAGVWIMLEYGYPFREHYPVGAGLVLFAATLACTTLLAAIFRPASVTVGTDGLEIRVSLWRYDLPYRRIADARFEGERFVVEYVDGRRSTLYAPAPRERRDALKSLVDEARREHARREPAPDMSALDREGRPIAVWREALRALLDRASAYREQSIDRRTLLRVLADVDIAAERRIAAAVALAASGGDAPTRIRAVATACANEELRVALERAASEELDEDTVDLAVSRERLGRRL